MNKLLYYLKEIWELLRDSFVTWYERDPFRNSAVISYYTIFSFPGLGVIIINLAGYFYGTQALTNEISNQLEGVMGASAAMRVEQIIANAYTSEGLTWSSIMSIIILIFGATGVFYQVQQTLNILWEVRPEPEQMLLKYLRDRLFSFGLILAIGFLLMVSMIISSLISALSSWMTVGLFGVMDFVLRLADTLISLGFITFLFAAIFKVLPDAKIRWSDVWAGALVSSLLFVIAKYFLSMYFSYSNPGSMYGAAGSIILIMIWTTYSALILLYGAEFTRVYTKRYGKKIEVSEFAVQESESGNKKEADFNSALKNQPKEN